MRTLHLLGSMLLVVAAEQAAAAGTIVVFGDHAGRHDLADTLTAQGHTVTDVGRLPTDLDAYDSAWHVGSLRPLSTDEQDRLAGFVASGGGIYLTGEAIGTDAMNESISRLLGSLLVNPGIDLSTAPDGMAGNHRFNDDAPAALTRLPNQLTVWQPGMAGVIEGAADRNVVARGPDGSVSGAAWRHGELLGGGQVIVMMDAGWLALDVNRAAIAANVARFLETQPITPPWDGPAPDRIVADPDAPPVAAPADDADGPGGETSAPTDDEPSAGCSAGGSVGSGALLALIALGLLVPRRRRA